MSEWTTTLKKRLFILHSASANSSGALFLWQAKEKKVYQNIDSANLSPATNGADVMYSKMFFSSIFLLIVRATLWIKKMKTIEIKNGNKTTFRIVPDDYEPETGFEQRDLTTSGRHLIGFSDVPNERWNKIFYKKQNEKQVHKNRPLPSTDIFNR